MQVCSNTNEILDPGHPVAVQSNQPIDTGDTFEIVDRQGNVLNVAEVTNVSRTPAGRYQNFMITGTVIA
jgi:hypothetical protein